MNVNRPFAPVEPRAAVFDPQRYAEDEQIRLKREKLNLERQQLDAEEKLRQYNKQNPQIPPPRQESTQSKEENAPKKSSGKIISATSSDLELAKVEDYANFYLIPIGLATMVYGITLYVANISRFDLVGNTYIPVADIWYKTIISLILYATSIIGPILCIYYKQNYILMSFFIILLIIPIIVAAFYAGKLDTYVLKRAKTGDDQAFIFENGSEELNNVRTKYIYATVTCAVFASFLWIFTMFIMKDFIARYYQTQKSLQIASFIAEKKKQELLAGLELAPLGVKQQVSFDVTA